MSLEELGMTNLHFTSIDQYRDADLLAYRRYGAEDGEELLVLCNLTEHEVPYDLPEGWADAEKLLGNYPDRNDALRPYECLILTRA